MLVVIGFWIFVGTYTGCNTSYNEKSGLEIFLYGLLFVEDVKSIHVNVMYRIFGLIMIFEILQ